MLSCNTDLPIVTKDDNSDVVSLKVESHSSDAGLEFDHLAGLDLRETEDSSDTISDGNDGSELFQVVLYDSLVRSVSHEYGRYSYLAPSGERSESDALVFK